MDDLVRDDTQLGKSVSLHPGSWEALNDPTLVHLLSLLDLLVHEVDDHSVVNILEFFRALEDLLPLISIFFTLGEDRVTGRDELPVEVLSNGFSSFMTVATGRTGDKHSPRYA